MEKTKKSTTYRATVSKSSCFLSEEDKWDFLHPDNVFNMDDVISHDVSLIFSPLAYVVVDIHTERYGKVKDYKKYFILSSNGSKYVTTNPFMFGCFIAIFEKIQTVSLGRQQIEFFIKESGKPPQSIPCCRLV